MPSSSTQSSCRFKRSPGLVFREGYWEYGRYCGNWMNSYHFLIDSVRALTGPFLGINVPQAIAAAIAAAISARRRVLPSSDRGWTSLLSHCWGSKIETRAKQLFSEAHLQAILSHTSSLKHFIAFLQRHRAFSVVLLEYYFLLLKAIRAIDFSNAVSKKCNSLDDVLQSHEFSETSNTANQELQDRKQQVLQILTRNELPSYITHTWIEVVSRSVKHKVLETLPDEGTEGLAEVFCLTDPSWPDNPIVFMSEEFNKTTQYGVDYVIGRNCRFLQGPHTDQTCVARIKTMLDAGQEHYETLLNYRRDGSPFINLIMMTPLKDIHGAAKYFLGAQIDVTGLAMSCHRMEALRSSMEQTTTDAVAEKQDESPINKLGSLADILDLHEVRKISERGGSLFESTFLSMRQKHLNGCMPGSTRHSTNGGKREGRKFIVDEEMTIPEVEHPAAMTDSLDSDSVAHSSLDLPLTLTQIDIFEHFLLTRPHPAMTILFASPSMQVPGILQTSLLKRIGASKHVREELETAFEAGQSITAQIKWATRKLPVKKKHMDSISSDTLLSLDDNSELLVAEQQEPLRWIHCTPLKSYTGDVGVWMVLLIKE
ncbi:hypothetical protein NLG97_g1502 [Lecanicillium saksenae]|uniref:Uncharacterized protein n=1 Tax=Lecanicillium saksenae TaxID=468837 RepID=A0ACC1R6V6_9HYPO|nr:hypothetical protein NLG97_g1502 [Lecanicillium saksenae]